MPNLVPDEHVVSQMSRIVSSDQSIARIPVFSDTTSTQEFYTDQSAKINSFFSNRPRTEKTEMITITHVNVKQLIDLEHKATSIRFELPIRDLRNGTTLLNNHAKTLP